ncbi:hypothetical protein Pelo_17942 [Pelomyxa schiedti]|nr:hypothetical protein Pelo_17942 [Pelomyxa schiedti]
MDMFQSYGFHFGPPRHGAAATQEHRRGPPSSDPRTAEARFLALVASSHPRGGSSTGDMTSSLAAPRWVTQHVAVHQSSAGIHTAVAVITEGMALSGSLSRGKSEGLCAGLQNDTANSKWFVDYSICVETLTIQNIEGWPDSHKGFDPVMVAVPGSRGLYPPIISFNRAVPDEAILNFRNPSSVELILFDVNLSHLTGKLAIITSVSLNAENIYDTVRAMRLRSGAVVFIARRESDREVVLIDPAATEVVPKRVTGNCTVITQVSSSVFCAWHSTRSFELWDCNNLDKPLRAVNSSDNFSQVVGGRGYLLGIVGRKVVVMEAFTGATVVTLDVSIGLQTATEFLIINQLSLLE